MTCTAIPGITHDRYGRSTIDKEHRGVGIFVRLGRISEEDAKRRLGIEIAWVESELQLKADARPRFVDCAARYLAESRGKRSVNVTSWHVRLLIPYIGTMEPSRIPDGTLVAFIADRRAAGVTATTINRSLEVVRTILNRSARVYRDHNGRPFLEGVPALITMLPEKRRPPYPVTWAEQDRLFAKLPARLNRMVLFAINTGLRDDNVCGLQWTWEVPVPEVGRSVFVIPPEAFKSGRAHVVILNDAAWSIVEGQRGQHPIWVFPHKGERVNTMNNTAWQRARRETDLRAVRVHDLRHSFACRLRAAGVSAEDREVLLGHANHSMAGHYASADVGRLLKEANLILNREETRTVLRVASGGAGGLWIEGPARVPQHQKRAHLRLVST